ANNTLITTMRTYNVPTSMAVTIDNRFLLVGHEHSQTIAVYDLETYQPQPYISSEAGAGNTVRSLAVSTKSILAASVDFQGKGHTGLTGAYAASAFDQFVVGANLLNSSLVPVSKLETATGSASGFAFIDAVGLRTTAPDAASAGIIQHVDLSNGAGIRPTRMV